jgi:hypothetical protein
MGAGGPQAAVGNVAESPWFPLRGLKKYICIMQCPKIRGDKLRKPDLSSPIANVLYQHFTYTRLLNIVQFCPENIANHSLIIRHLSIGINAKTIIKPIITNSLNSVHTKK